MLRSVYKPLLVLGLAIIVTACQNKTDNAGDNKLSTDIITNPVTATGENTRSKLPLIEFKETKKDFGMIVQGEKVSHTFHFTNTGGADLVISDASSTCGCTVPEWSKKPIKPGESGTMTVVFNSTGRTGAQTKSVKVLTNAQPNTVELEISAEIYVPTKK